MIGERLARAKIREVPGEHLEPFLSRKGTLRFTVDRPIPASLVRKIVKARIEENEALGRR